MQMELKDIYYMQQNQTDSEEIITEIKNNIALIESLGGEIKFLDIPLIETEDSITNKLLREQFINTLSYLEEKETLKRKQRQEECIAAMPINSNGKKVSSKTGREVGRPKSKIPNDFKSVYEKLNNGQLAILKI